MFIVFENNPQFYNVSDQFKIFSKVEAAARYAINRGLTSPYFKDYKSLEALIGQAGKSVTGGTMPNPQITIANLDPVDAADPTKTAAAEGLLQAQLTAAQNGGALIQADLDAANKKIADLTAQLATATAPKAKKDKADPAPAAAVTTVLAQTDLGPPKEMAVVLVPLKDVEKAAQDGKTPTVVVASTPAPATK